MVGASPSITFPINSQVPPVARVAQPFIFQFALTTFTSSSTNAMHIQYSLDGSAPTWIQIESDTRTFFGTPSAQDLGSVEFGLIATDGTGNTLMLVTLVIVDSSIPQAMGNITDQLAHYGILSGPMTLALYTNTPFNIAFSPNSFTAMSNPLFYATSTNRSPLPSWIGFNPDTMTFSGLTPPLISSSQTFWITLFASRVPGFAEAWLNFSLEIGTHKLTFQEVSKTIDIASSGAISYKIPRAELLLDARPISEDDFSDMSVQLPSWLQWNSSSMHISGQAPSGTTTQEVVVKATDVYEDEATMVLRFQLASFLFTKQIGVINATMGTTFTYVFSRSLFNNPNVIVSVELDQAVTWLHFSSDTLVLSGIVPYTAQPALIGARITAYLPSISDAETQSFFIRTLPASPATTVESRNASPTSVETAPTQTSTSSSHGLRESVNVSSGTWIGIGFAIGVVGLLLVGALLWYCWYKQLHKKPWISNPIVHGRNFRSVQRRKYHKDNVRESKGAAEIESGHLDGQSAVPLNEIRCAGNFIHPSNDRHTISRGTDLQPSDEDLLNIMNRTSLGIDTLICHKPHATETMFPQTTMDGRRLPRMRHRRATQRSSVSLLGYRISKLSQKRLSWASAGRERSNQRRKSGIQSTHLDGDVNCDDILASDVANTQLTSETDAEAAHTNPPQAWIRCVTPSSEAITTTDNRSLADRRQSYIHHRASTNNGNPLFAASDLLSKHMSAAYRLPLQHRSSNTSHRLASRAKVTRSKSSSIGVRTSAPSRPHIGTRRSFRSGDEWQTVSSIYSGDGSEVNGDEDVDDENRSRVTIMDNAMYLEEEREARRYKWSHRLRRDGRGRIMDSIIEGDALFSSSRQDKQTQQAQQQLSSQRHGQSSYARERLVSTGTNASSVYGTDAFI